MKHNKQQGFTLIELVVVIIILGILAATALPKFIDLSEDAAAAAAQGVAGALSSASAMNFAKYQISSGAASAVTAGDCDDYNTLLAGGVPSAMTLSGVATCTGGEGSIDQNCTITHDKATSTPATVNLVCTGT